MFRKDFTFMMIKPDAVQDGHAGKIIDRILQEGFKICGLRLTRMTIEMAKQFYKVHSGRPFYNELTEMIASGPVFVGVLQKKDAVASWREVIGATDPSEAAEGTIRRLYARNKGENAVHGSDSSDNAAFEISFFFSISELLGNFN